MFHVSASVAMKYANGQNISLHSEHSCVFSLFAGELHKHYLSFHFLGGHPCIRLDFNTWVGEFVVWAFGLRFPFLFHPLFLHVLFSSRGCKLANTLIHWTVVCTFVSGVHTLVNMVARLIIVKRCATDMTREYNYATLNSCVYFSSSAHGGWLYFSPINCKSKVVIVLDCPS